MVPFERNPRYVDRNVVDLVKGMLFSDRDAQRIAIYGLGGVGKTQIALELVHQTREQYPDCSVFWIPAMSPDSIHQAYLEIASQLGISAPEREDVDMTQLVNDHLNQPHNGRWLLIFDNADDLETWDPDLNESSTSVIPKKSLPQHHLGAIFFTTRSHKVARYLGIQQIIEIPEMDLKSATRVLENSLVDKSLLRDKDGTTKLLQHLTYLPLAIIQAAAYMNQNSMSIASYISLLDGQEQYAVELLSEEFEDVGRYQSIKNPVATTWLTSFGQIRKLSTHASDYLCFMACIDYRDIPISLLPQYDEIEHQKALGLLQSYCFIRLRPDHKSLDLHRLVHLATRITLRPRPDSAAFFHWEPWSLVHLANRFPTQTWNHNSTCRAYLPHALKLLEATPDDENLDSQMRLASRVAYTLQHNGRFKEAQKWQLKALKCAKMHVGSEDPFTLSCVGGLAALYCGQSRFEEARDIMTQNLQVQIKVLGVDSIDFAYATEALGAVHRSLGDTNVAEWLITLSFRAFLKFAGPESPETIRVVGRMNDVYLAQGRFSNATVLCALWLEMANKALGPDNQQTIAAEISLSAIYASQGLLRDAERIRREALERNRAVLGPDNPNTIGIMSGLAHILSDQGRDTEAISMMTNCAELSAKVIGPHSKDTKLALKFIEYTRDQK